MYVKKRLIVYIKDFNKTNCLLLVAKIVTKDQKIFLGYIFPADIFFFFIFLLWFEIKLCLFAFSKKKIK